MAMLQRLSPSRRSTDGPRFKSIKHSVSSSFSRSEIIFSTREFRRSFDTIKQRTIRICSLAKTLIHVSSFDWSETWSVGFFLRPGLLHCRWIQVSKSRGTMVSTSKVRLCSSENLFRLECKERRSCRMRTTIRSMSSLFRVRTISIVSICLFRRGCWPIRIKWRNYWTSSVVNSCPTMNWRKLPKKLKSHRSWFSSRRKPLICSTRPGRGMSCESAPVKVFSCHWIPPN